MAGSSFDTTISIGGVVAQVSNCTGPDMSASVVESKVFGGGWVRRYTGIKDAGTVSFTVNYSYTDHNTLAGYLGTKQTGIVVTFYDLSTATFDAIMTKFSLNPDSPESMMQAEIELAIDDAVELAPVDD